LWLHSLKVAQLLRSAACLHTNQSRSYLNHLVLLLKRNVTLTHSQEAQKVVNRLFFYMADTNDGFFRKSLI